MDSENGVIGSTRKPPFENANELRCRNATCSLRPFRSFAAFPVGLGRNRGNSRHLPYCRLLWSIIATEGLSFATSRAKANEVAGKLLNHHDFSSADARGVIGDESLCSESATFGLQKMLIAG